MNPKFSIIVPIYNMDNAQVLLERNLRSIAQQNFTNYEVIISDNSEDTELETWLGQIELPIRYFKNPLKGMANNTNFAIEQANGDLIKILFQDDYFYSPDSLVEIRQHFTSNFTWLATSCTHTLDGINTFNDHQPYYSESENTIGSPSVVTFRNGVTPRFDPNFFWVLDLDWYKQLYRKHGKPKIYDKVNVVIGIHMGQETQKLSDERKLLEENLLKLKYDKQRTV